MNNSVQIPLVRTNVTNQYQNYEIKDPAGVLKLSVPLQERDSFERSYSDSMRSIQFYSEYAQQNQTKRKVKAYTAMGGGIAGTILGAVAPFKLLKKSSKIVKTLLAIPAALVTGLLTTGILSKFLVDNKQLKNVGNNINNFSQQIQRYATGYEKR